MQPDERELLLRARENVLERSRRAARAVDGRRLEEGDGLLLIAAPDVSWINGAHVTREPADPQATLARTRAFFAGRGFSWHLTAASDVAEAVAPAAEAAGLTFDERRPGMPLAPLAGAVPEVLGLAIEAVRDPAALAVFHATSAGGFEGGTELFPRVYPTAVLSAPDTTLYVGYLDGEPVATAVRTTSYRIAGIGGVSTVPARRGRGIGEAITWRAALDGLAEGCVASFLEATEMGFRVYARMGYRHVIDFHVWRA